MAGVAEQRGGAPRPARQWFAIVQGPAEHRVAYSIENSERGWRPVGETRAQHLGIARLVPRLDVPFAVLVDADEIEEPTLPTHEVADDVRVGSDAVGHLHGEVVHLGSGHECSVGHETAEARRLPTERAVAHDRVDAVGTHDDIGRDAFTGGERDARGVLIDGDDA
jgi:hypothetical protein